MITEQQIINKIHKLPRTRKTNREKLIKEISLKFLSFFKQNGKAGFSRSHLNFLVNGLNVSNRLKQRITTQILNFLKQENLIREDIVYTPIYTFRNKPLFSFDYGSYFLLMKKNGYKKYLYKWVFDKERKAPRKIKKGSLDINERLPESLDFDVVETKSFKSHKKQGVYANSNLSEVKDFCFYSEKKVYSIL